jgi:acetylornithine deacetylase/succinyl-diaminopimelate desuccinylase-like protein
MTEAASCTQPNRLRRLLRRLIDIYSPSGKEEEVLAFLHGYLKRHGLPVIRQPVDECRYNLVVVPPGKEVQHALIGHLDTVAAYDFDHYGCEEQGDPVQGLGAADMKGGCAALVEAYLSTWQEHACLEATIRFTNIHTGYELPDKAPVVDALQDLYQKKSLPWKPEPFCSHSDANFLWESSVKPLVLGPGSLDKAHARDESVSFQQVKAAAELYCELISGLAT